ncbi:MAG: CubicO group peptidase (beta-lactamase class C family) [Paracoccaceae bacterium]
MSARSCGTLFRKLQITGSLSLFNDRALLRSAAFKQKETSMKPVFSLFLAGAFALTAHVAAAADLPIAAPSDVGMSEAQLGALDARIQAEIDRGSFPGAVITVLRDGQVAHHAALGKLGQGDAAMLEDALFRIYSMTKPIVSVAAMMLVEQGRLGLSHPLAAYLPAYASMTVMTDDKDADGKPVTRPARRAITIQDLMRHTSGLTYGFFGAGPAREAYRAAGIGVGAMAETNIEFANKLATLPLEYEPGTTWEYSRSTDVLGAVIEVVTGKPLGEALKEMVLDPLDMIDTGFFVAEADHARIAEGNEGEKIGAGPMFDPRDRPVFESGGGGLVSTARDYARFAQMLLNGGSLDGVHLLGPQTVAYMTADHLDDQIKPGKYYLPGAGIGFGLGVGVRHDRGVVAYNGAAGTYYWGGAGGTYWYNDPENGIAVVFMMQSPASRLKMRPLTHDMVAAAITD